MSNLVLEVVVARQEKRSLYDCANARVKGQVVYCCKGHEFPYFTDLPDVNGVVSLSMVARGAPLRLGVCQHCKDYDDMGKIPAPDRGWIKTRKRKEKK